MRKFYEYYLRAYARARLFYEKRVGRFHTHMQKSRHRICIIRFFRATAENLSPSNGTLNTIPVLVPVLPAVAEAI